MTPIFKLEYNPIHALNKSPIDNEYVSLLLKSWLESTTKSDSERSYRLTFPKGSSKKLMIHRTGDLKGLKTTSIIENGKIEANAGLEEIFKENAYELLCVALFGLIDGHYKDINFTLQKIHQTKQFEIQAKFERVTYVLESTFDILPELLIDKSLHTAYLNQIVDSNSNCYELFSFFKQELKARCSEFSKKTRDDTSPSRVRNRLYYLRELINDNAYAALERFSFGKVCEMLLSRNFTSKYLTHTKNQISNMIEDLMEIVKSSTYEEDRFRRQWQSDIDYQELSKESRHYEEKQLNKYISDYEEVMDDLKKKINTSVSGLYFISEYIDTKDISMLIKDGGIFINE
ncbi:TPA: hypothetical protein ACNUUK_001920 [Aeromonas salmonicida subsp. smithia]